MVTPLDKGPGLCPVCGQFEPAPLRPNALHICPGKRVVPTFPEPGDQGFLRLEILVQRFKVAHRKGKDLSDDERQELGKLLKVHTDRYPKQQLQNWMERQKNADAIVHLTKAAKTVLLAYSAYIDPQFIAAVREQFLDRTPEDEVPCTCFMWHETESSWKMRLNDVGGPPEVWALTPFWDGKESKALPAKLAGTYAPVNRSIEFPKPDLDPLTHEMIHWCTAPDFDKRSWSVTDPDERKLVREGTVEWLKRNATKDWNSGGYPDVVSVMKELIDAKAVIPERLMAAFFGGKDTQAVIDDLIGAFRSRNTARSNAAHDENMQRERTILSGMIGKSTFSIERSPDFRQRVFAAYGGLADSALATEIRNAKWLAYVRARQAGDNDGVAHAKAQKV